MTKAVKPRRQLIRRESLTFGALLLPLNVFFKLYYADQEKDERKNKWQKSSRREVNPHSWTRNSNYGGSLWLGLV